MHAMYGAVRWDDIILLHWLGVSPFVEGYLLIFDNLCNVWCSTSLSYSMVLLVVFGIYEFYHFQMQKWILTNSSNKWAIAIWKIKFFTYYFIMGGSKTRAQNLPMQWYYVEVLTMSSKVLNCCGEYINIDLLCLLTVMLSCSGSDKS